MEQEAPISRCRRTMDKGELALYATGLVPAGFKFMTNATPEEKSTDAHNQTTDSLVAAYQASGYDVFVVKGHSFDVHGRDYGNDAILVKKRV